MSKWCVLTLVCLSLVCLRCGFEYPPTSEGDIATLEKGALLGTGQNKGYFFRVGKDLTSLIHKNKGDWNIDFMMIETEGTSDNLKRIDRGEIQLGMANSAITWLTMNGRTENEKASAVRAVMTLMPNHSLFVCRDASPIYNFSEIKGKRVVLGPKGAQYELFIKPILKAHNIEMDEIQVVYADHEEAYELLSKDMADVVFFGGTLPIHTIAELCGRHELHFIPFDQKALLELIKAYPYFSLEEIPANSYCGLESDFILLKVGSIQILTSVSADDNLIYNFTKTLHQNIGELCKEGASLEGMSSGDFCVLEGVPYHSAAVRYYREIGLWNNKPRGAEQIEKIQVHELNHSENLSDERITE